MPGECTDHAGETVERDCGQQDGCAGTGERCLGCGIGNRLTALFAEAGKQSESSAEQQPKIERGV